MEGRWEVGGGAKNAFTVVSCLMGGLMFLHCVEFLICRGVCVPVSVCLPLSVSVCVREGGGGGCHGCLVSWSSARVGA